MQLEGLVNAVAGTASGTARCGDGAIDLDLPLVSAIHMSGDLFNPESPPDISGIQPCPLCDTFCSSGGNGGLPCDVASDCPGGTCGSSPVCLGGPNDGQPCAPGTSDETILGEGYPTSHDCPPEPMDDITAYMGGVRVLTFTLTSSTQDLIAVDHPQQDRRFCGFCADMILPGWGCFDGDDDPRCLNSTAQPGCRPESRCNGGTNHGLDCIEDCDCPGATCEQEDISGCGNPIPCDSDSDCSGTYESCVQASSGAFSHWGATQIRVSGWTDGQCLSDGLAHPSALVGLFCIGPTFDPLIDGEADLPGPGAVLLQGDVQLQP